MIKKSFFLECLHPEDEGTMSFQNVRNYSDSYTGFFSETDELSISILSCLHCASMIIKHFIIQLMHNI